MRGVLLVVLGLLAVAPAASASQLIDRDAKDMRLTLAPDGSALVTYSARGRRRTVEARSAVDALQPTPSRPQVAFRLNYAGKPTAKNVCRGYDGPPIAWLVGACKAPDGSYWVLQSWQRALPNYGLAPNAAQAAWELRLAHWRGPLAKLEVWTDWSYGGRFHDLFGRLSYGGQPVHGFHSTGAGVPLDTYGRNLYLDTLNSAHGPGWKRENSFLARNPTGAFCYGFFPHGARPAGRGERYRITVIGPGVTPDVMWEGAGLPDFDPANAEHVAREQQANTILAQIAGATRLCRP
jgi:hypothetical protein